MRRDQTISALHIRVAQHRPAILQFMRDLCAIPSMGSQLRAVGERVIAEMQVLGFDEARFDVMGNVIGKINGRLVDGQRRTPLRTLVFDSHLDTVGIGDPSQWAWDPFIGKVEDGILYARGACDEKGSTPGMVYGLALARELGLLDGWSAYYFGNMEEWCDGIAPRSFVEFDPKVKPDFVVIGEPTRMQVYRGHKGRVEMQVTAKGRSAHAASNWLGDNAIYKLLPIIAGIRDLDPNLRAHEFLGKGTITVSDLHVRTPSINAVPDEATIYIDRRVTFGDTLDSALAEVQAVIDQTTDQISEVRYQKSEGASQPPAAKSPVPRAADITLALLTYAEPSYTGFKLVLDKYFPAWALEENHAYVQAAVDTTEAVFGRRAPTGKWDFSTNGTYWAGQAGIPAIGFGPGDEVHAHTVLEQVPLEDVVQATCFYAALPAFIAQDIAPDAG